MERTSVGTNRRPYPTEKTVLILWAAVILFANIQGWSPHGAFAQTTVVFWTNHRLEDEPVFEELIAAFEAEHPQITIDWQNQVDGETDYYGKLITAIAGGVAPDVFYVRPGTDSHFVKSGWIYDIDPFVRKDAAELFIEDFIPAQVAELQYNGKWWALPFDFSVIGLYYNQDLFDMAGVVYPTYGWSWDDLIEASKKLTRREGDRTTHWALTGLTWYFSQWAEGFIMSHGGRLFNETYTASAANDPATVNALQLPVTLVHELQVSPRFDTDGYSNLFFAGQAAMTLDGSWATTTHRLNNQFRFDVSSLPMGKAGLVVAATGGGWAMSATTSVPDAAWEWMKVLVSHEASRKLVVEPVRSLPPRVSLMNEWAEQVAFSGAPASATLLAMQVVEHGRAVPRVGFAFNSVLGRYRNALAHGEMSAREAAERIHHDFQTEFERLARE